MATTRVLVRDSLKDVQLEIESQPKGLLGWVSGGEEEQRPGESYTETSKRLVLYLK